MVSFGVSCPTTRSNSKLPISGNVTIFREMFRSTIALSNATITNFTQKERADTYSKQQFLTKLLRKRNRGAAVLRELIEDHSRQIRRARRQRPITHIRGVHGGNYFHIRYALEFVVY
jgi:hypothetical protein